MEHNASAEWIATHKRLLLPETYIELTLSVSEPGIQRDATMLATVEENFSEVEEIITTLTPAAEKYSSLEWNGWGLGGDFEYFDGSPVDPGYVTSVLSGADTRYETYPTITVAFSKVHTAAIPGITITWAAAFNEWATDFRITSYNGDAVVAQKDVTGNTETVSVVWMEIQNYDRITIEILGWSHPGHRARVSSLCVGVRNIYTKSDLLSYTHSQSVDLLSAALPKNEISFGLRNDDDRWNPDNPSGVERYLSERQEISVRYGMLVNGVREWITGGRFYLSDWSTPRNGLSANFSARDVLEFMNEVYTGPTSGTLYDIVTAAFVQADLPILENGEPCYFVDESLKDYSTSFSQEYTLVEILQLAAHMSAGVLYQRRDGVFYVGPRGMILSDYVIDQNISYAHPEFEISKPLKAVSVAYGDGQSAVITTGTTGEVQTVNNDFILTEADALRVGQATANVLNNRKTISGEFRADPRLDPLDVVKVYSKYAENNVVITDIEISTTGGAFRGRYSGKAVS